MSDLEAALRRLRRGEVREVKAVGDGMGEIGIRIEYRAVGTRGEAPCVWGRPADTVHEAHVALDRAKKDATPFDQVHVEYRTVSLTPWERT